MPVIPGSTIINIPVPAVPAIPAAASTKMLGNLYMSSCPGKKGCVSFYRSCLLLNTDANINQCG